jgi:hypothetical protein
MNSNLVIEMSEFFKKIIDFKTLKAQWYDKNLPKNNKSNFLKNIDVKSEIVDMKIGKILQTFNDNLNFKK